MRKILIIGAGQSTASLIDYLLNKSTAENLRILVADMSRQAAEEKIKGHPSGEALALDVTDEKERRKLIKAADIVISMLPAHMHLEVAKDCLHYKKNLVTPSYISKEMKALDAEVKKQGLVFMNEIGLDPGIDHLSAMKVIDRIRKNGGKMLLFESFAGGLIAPESDTNLWNYKFTWNPRNVVLAGQSQVAKFFQEGTYKYIPYHKLFRRTEILNIPGHGKFEAYPNRDSLKYIKEYGLENILTLYRGTIRRIGFSRAWNMFVQLGMTDDSYEMENSEAMSYRDFTNSFLAYNPNDSVELKLRSYLKIDQDDIMWDKLVELGIFNKDKKVGLKNATPARILQKILMESWSLQPDDKDMIIMHHKFGYEYQNEKRQIESSMVVIGEDQTHTAMAKTVGLPVAITTLFILNGKIATPGVQLPLQKEVYEPVLDELEKYDIKFHEIEVPYLGYNPNNITG